MNKKLINFIKVSIASSFAMACAISLAPAYSVRAAVPTNVAVAVSGGSSNITSGPGALTFNVSVSSDAPVNGITAVFYHTELGTSLTGVATNLSGNGGVYTLNLSIPSNTNLGEYKLGTVYVSNRDGGVAFYDSSVVPNGNTPTSINKQQISFSGVSFNVYNSGTDSTPPTLTDITIDRHVGTDTDKSYFEICLSVQDNYGINATQRNSGVSSVDLSFENSDGSWVNCSTGVYKGADGYYHGIIYDEDVKDPGLYVLHYLVLRDNAGNAAIYNKTGGRLTSSESMMDYFHADVDYIAFRVYGSSTSVVKPQTTTQAATQAAVQQTDTDGASPKTGEISNVFFPVIVLAGVALAVLCVVTGVVAYNARRKED